jgi:hypothetical protein
LLQIKVDRAMIQCGVATTLTLLVLSWNWAYGKLEVETK